jgi:hypothetical protein
VNRLRIFWSCSWEERLNTRMTSIDAKSKCMSISSMKRRKVWSAIRRPKDMKEFQKGQKLW